jgi:hypothetical protein
MTKSFTDSIRFTADSLVPRHLISPEVRAKIAILANSKFSPEEQKAAEDDIYASLSHEAQEAFESFGVRLPYEAVELKRNYKDFIYQLFDVG